MSEQTPLEDVLLATSTLNALELAAARRNGHPLSTADILLGLVSADSEGVWEAIQLRSAYVTDDDPPANPDPDSRPSGTWDNVPLTRTAAAALQAAVGIAAEYHLIPLPPGALALGLLADPSTGASRMLLGEGECAHAELLAMVQSDVLGADLDGFTAARPNNEVRRGWRLSRTLKGSQTSPLPVSLRTHDWIDPTPGALTMLADAVDAAKEDPELAELLSSMLLNSDQLHAVEREVQELPDVTRGEVFASAERRSGLSLPDPGTLIIAAALSGSQRVNAALRRIALSPNELAAQVGEYRLRSRGDHDVSSNTIRFTIANALFGVLTSALVIRASFDGSGHWWRLAFLWLVWSGYPQLGPVGATVVAAVMAVLVAPIVGAVHLLGVLPEIGQARSELRTILSRTGVELKMVELRRVTQRTLSARARRASTRKQTQRAALHARRERLSQLSS